MKDKTFSIMVDGKELTYTIIKILIPTNAKNKYIIYTDGKETYASRFENLNNQIILKDIESKREWKYIDSYLESML